MKYQRVRVMCRMVVLLMAVSFIVKCGALSSQAAERFGTVGAVTYMPENLDGILTDSGMYQVVDKYSPARDQPSSEGKIIEYMKQGEYFHGEEIINRKNNSWVKYTSLEGKTCYVYMEHVKKHFHEYKGYCDEVADISGYCECGYLYVIHEDKPFTIDCQDVLCQVIAGSWSSTQSGEAVVIRTALGIYGAYIPYIGPVLVAAMSIGDTSADVYYCAHGDCDVIALVLDTASVVSLGVDELEKIDSIRVNDRVKQAIYIAEKAGTMWSIKSAFEIGSNNDDFVGLSHDDFKKLVKNSTCAVPKIR